jgi:hypothetical protein
MQVILEQVLLFNFALKLHLQPIEVFDRSEHVAHDQCCLQDGEEDNHKEEPQLSILRLEGRDARHALGI